LGLVSVLALVLAPGVVSPVGDSRVRWIHFAASRSSCYLLLPGIWWGSYLLLLGVLAAIGRVPLVLRALTAAVEEGGELGLGVSSLLLLG
jgi:hypothetical protein